MCRARCRARKHFTHLEKTIMKPVRISMMVALSALVLTTLGARQASAQQSAQQAERPAERSPSAAANTGLLTGVGPILLVPSDGGPLGGGLELDARYGIPAGPVIVAPGARAAGYGISGRFIGDLMPTGRVTLPLGPFAPYAVGGIGAGFLTNPGEGGVALLGGLGVMVHFGRMIAVGLEGTFRTITGTDFQMFALGPMVTLGL
jgi:hypothetical protein